jgi:hypothetical protein
MAEGGLRHMMMTDRVLGDPKILGSAAELLGWSARLWRNYFSEGAMHLERLEDRSATMRLENPGLHPLGCSQILPGWIERALVLAGATPLVCEHVACSLKGAEACQYQVEWSSDEKPT